MIRENLSPYPANEQFAFGMYESESSLSSDCQMAYGTIAEKMDRLTYYVTNKNFINRVRWVEFLDVLGNLRTEFRDPAELKHLFLTSGVDTRHGNVMEMYLERDNFSCNYCIQVNMDPAVDHFVKVVAYAKDVKKHPHRH